MPMCRIRFVCKSKELGGGGASGLVRVGGADVIFCPSLGGEGLRSGGDAGWRDHFISKWYRGPEISTKILLLGRYLFYSFIAVTSSIKYDESLNLV